ncbi:hypothetical protein HK101_000811 [Irineochytrium annulatum]|nr:hypothetical protein HK101_000811 [Irineochytrium annulatum]
MRRLVQTDCLFLGQLTGLALPTLTSISTVCCGYSHSDVDRAATVGCDEEGYMTELSLSAAHSPNITNLFPSTGWPQSLRTLALVQMHLTGTIQDWVSWAAIQTAIGNALPSPLVSVDLRENALSGSIPESLPPGLTAL